jgi:hypothetical protein
LPPKHTEDVLRAELRLYKDPAAPDTETSFLVQCYQLVNGETGEQQLQEELEVDFSSEGWLIIDVSKAARAWQLDYQTNQGSNWPNLSID